MPALVIRGSPTKWHGNARRWGTRAFETYDGDEIAMMAAAVEKEMAECGCDPKQFRPQHMTGYADPIAGKAFTYQCLSGSRWWNPKTHQMEGRSHCSCDYCF